MTVNDKIEAELSSIEGKYDVTILFACESGSRAWGFPSQDSDYDVRFIYLHPPSWYLTVNNWKQRDVIEKPIDDELDVSGWELRKALNLLHKSNPALIEWINSPIVYRKDEEFHRELSQVLPDYYSPKACFYHYSHMANGNNKGYLQGEEVRIKKYFYVLRPILAMRWLELGKGIVPTEFAKLVDGVLDDEKLIDEINLLLERKSQGFESKFMKRIPIISDFIESEIKRFSELSEDLSVSNSDFTGLNTLFRNTLQRAYQLEL